MNTRLIGKVDKGWGYEIIWATNEKYAGKLLVFEKTGSKFSMHFHKEKDESWFVSQGKFKLRILNTENTSISEIVLFQGDSWHNPPMVPHQLEALVDNSIIIEVSTPDSVEDNYRIFPGDSQK
jgi:mannose-6-phosphate isomerase-like protein (cupin superfamily)